MTRVPQRAATVAALAALVFGAGVASAATAGERLPKHFPKPPHSTVTLKTQAGAVTAYTLKVASEPSAFRFWKKQLPKHGWTITKAKSKHGAGAIVFSGHGYGGRGTAIGIGQTSAAISFDKTG